MEARSNSLEIIQIVQNNQKIEGQTIRKSTVTRERIRAIEAKALRKLRHLSSCKKLKSFVDETSENKPKEATNTKEEVGQNVEAKALQKLRHPRKKSSKELKEEVKAQNPEGSTNKPNKNEAKFNMDLFRETMKAIFG